MGGIATDIDRLHFGGNGSAVAEKFVSSNGGVCLNKWRQRRLPATCFVSPYSTELVYCSPSPLKALNYISQSTRRHVFEFIDTHTLSHDSLMRQEMRASSPFFPYISADQRKIHLSILLRRPHHLITRKTYKQL